MKKVLEFVATIFVPWGARPGTRHLSKISSIVLWADVFCR